MSESTPAAPAAQPGWYPQPDMPGYQRFWDGKQWTGTPAPVKDPVTASGLLILGWIMMVFMPLVGFVIGIVVIAKGKVAEGISMTVGSVLVTVVLASLMRNAGTL